MDFGANGPKKIVTRANLKASVHAYEEVRTEPSCPFHLTSFSAVD